MNIRLCFTLLPILSCGLASAAVVPAALQGQWEYGSVSPIEYYDTTTGKYAESSGTSEIIRIKADGSYERNGIIVVTTYGCTSKLLTSSKGNVSLKGNLLTLTPVTAYNKGYTCSPSQSYETRKLIPSAFTWKLAGDVLVLGDPTGKTLDSRYNRPRTLTASPAGQEPRRVSGMVSAPQGHSLNGAAVIACRVDRGCGAEDGSVRFVTLSGAGHQQPFTLDNLDPTPYELLAWEDTNGNGTPDEGDWVDAASAKGAAGLTLTPPMTNVSLNLEQWR
ncbi:hypothetical protein [Deinococcus humi]|uniref:Uncharacterized protein n=1 Tax=Deinococcus humi TaxID=662880 RepID=A0A7W8JV24_9DEIO|nr:hypothetical protein [Deinococcus humi]MBB5363787.1 hypothetical protein [Deinococcus humi]GGO32009.1 hypothetical protein GCM10008949_28850 [Deinococcus humi]